MHQAKQPNLIPPRRFPKKQYRKLGRHLWIILVGIIMIIAAALSILVIASRDPQPKPHHSAKSVKIERQPKRAHRQSRHVNPVKINPKTGEKLLGHWLIKLHYSSAKDQELLSRYQRSTPQRDVEIGQRLDQLSRSKTSTVNQRTRIRRFINRQFK